MQPSNRSPTGTWSICIACSTDWCSRVWLFLVFFFFLRHHASTWLKKHHKTGDSVGTCHVLLQVSEKRNNVLQKVLAPFRCTLPPFSFSFQVSCCLAYPLMQKQHEEKTCGETGINENKSHANQPEQRTHSPLGCSSLEYLNKRIN